VESFPWGDAAVSFNTLGEAGKVYYAHRFQTGRTIFEAGDQPPFYPSMHGALLHAAVGMIGRLFDLPMGSLYGVGRAISIVMTLLALAGAGVILRAIGASGRGAWSSRRPSSRRSR
jgi:hypothetical protein